MKKLATAFVALALFIAASNAHAVTVSVTYKTNALTNIKKEKGEILQASATFVVSNLQLFVTLSNTGTVVPKSPGDILTGVFFDIAGIQSLKPVSATVAPGSSVIGQRLPTGFDGNVGGEWAYKGDLVGAPAGDTYGISSTKLSFFKTIDLFPGGKIRGTSPLSGAQFGITTLDDLVPNKQSGINKGLVRSAVVFVFNISGLPSDFTANDIKDVTFQYGTSIKSGLDITGQMVAQIPEPSTVTLIALGLVGALALTRSRTPRR
ncbi:MAG: XDD4 family exosortase-dependent surface protein [Verrucomicrobiia bacterium]|jgi:hypothetical protein